MRIRTPAAVQERVLELLKKGFSQNKVAGIAHLSRTTVQNIAKNGVVIDPPVKSKKHAPSIVENLFVDTESKRCVECGKMMKIGFEDNTCFECKTTEDLKKKELKNV